MIGITLFKSEGEVFIHCDQQGRILVSETPAEIVKDMENTYNEFHARNYESSMSACIHYIFFQPRVVTVKDIEEIKEHIAAEQPRHVSLSHVSGYAHAITCRPEAMSYWEKAAKPQLISKK